MLLKIDPTATDLLMGATAEFAMATIGVREVLDRMPNSREKSLAITKLEELQFWGTSAVAQGLTVAAPEHSPT